MSDIELVVKIPERIHYGIEKGITVNGSQASQILIDAVKNGTPLPRGHGRLIDADKFLKDNEAYTGFILDSRFFGGKNAYKDALEDLVDEASTIIEAESEVEDGNDD